MSVDLQQKLDKIILGVSFSLVLILYLTALNAPFYFDDYNQSILGNETIINFKSLTEVFQFLPSRFIGILSFLLNIQLGIDPWHFRLVNIFIHLINVFLVFNLTAILLAEFCGNDDKIARNAAAIAALVFAIHPVNTAAVTYIAQRFALLNAMFYFSTLLYYWKFRLAGKTRFLIIAAVLALLGFFNKEVSASIIGPIILSEFILFRSSLQELAKKKKLLLFYIFLAVTPVLLFLFATSHYQDSAAAQSKPEHFHYLLTQTHVLLEYFRLFFAPLNQNFDYAFPLHKEFDVGTIIATLTHLAIIALAFITRKRMTAFAFGIFFFYTTLAPESFLVSLPDLIFEHRLYLPMFGLLLAVTDLSLLILTKFATRRKPGLMARYCFYVYIALLCILTLQRNELWSDEVAFWEENVKKSPQKERPKLHLGLAYVNAKKWAEAQTLYDGLLKGSPNDLTILKAKADAFLAAGDLESALKVIDQIIAVNSHSDFYQIKSSILKALGRPNEAMETLKKCKSLFPESPVCDRN